MRPRRSDLILPFRTEGDTGAVSRRIPTMLNWANLLAMVFGPTRPCSHRYRRFGRAPARFDVNGGASRKADYGRQCPSGNAIRSFDPLRSTFDPLRQFVGQSEWPQSSRMGEERLQRLCKSTRARFSRTPYPTRQSPTIRLMPHRAMDSVHDQSPTEPVPYRSRSAQTARRSRLPQRPGFGRRPYKE